MHEKTSNLNPLGPSHKPAPRHCQRIINPEPAPNMLYLLNYNKRAKHLKKKHGGKGKAAVK